eukprot:TRINITY_DN441_c0_g1_i4.p1 TRINITY_DN441_c0_g1~~TRINITY_DN441_c0_g1_i4.p1  ORF type:complete len:813 (-),score=121.47 TRINITY_DN441_c0_g1_i4:54-2492(-)
MCIRDRYGVPVQTQAKVAPPPMDGEIVKPEEVPADTGIGSATRPSTNFIDSESHGGMAQLGKPWAPPGGGGSKVGLGQVSFDQQRPPNPAYQCPPEFLRMTINAAPENAALADSTRIPFGCIVHPMATPKSGSIPVISSASGIIRCRKCRIYINPFVNFQENGRVWRCNFCGTANEVSREYYRELDATGNRADLAERPELTQGCCEFIAPAEYMVRRPMPPTYLFVIDVSYYSISSGMLKVCVEAIKASLDNLPDQRRSRIGFITYNTSVHFYNLNSNLTSPRMLVVSDIDDVFIPLPNDLLVNLKDSREVIDALLAKLPAMHQNTNNVEAVAGPALKAAWNVLRTVGGKLMLFCSKLPTKGIGALKPRENKNLLGTDKEVNLLRAQTDFYKKFAIDATRQQISVDTFLFSSYYSDLATLGHLSRYTGGELQYYPSFNVATDGTKFFYDLKRMLSRETGWEAVMRVRTSTGVSAAQHFGNFYIKSSDLLSLPNVDADKAFGVQFKVRQPLSSMSYFSVQSALLYTTSSGERRIRVSTLCLPVARSSEDLFKMADIDTIISLTAKMGIEKSLMNKLSDARQAIVNQCVDVLTVYRRTQAAQSTSLTQILLPPTLKLLPLYTLALLKNTAFMPGADVSPDQRTYSQHLIRTMPVTLVIPYVYPKLYALKMLTPEYGTVKDGVTVLPPVNNLLSQKIDRSGVYLLDNGQYLLFWVGKGAPPDLLQLIFGVPSLYTVEEQKLQLPSLDNEVSKKIVSIVAGIRQQRPLFQKLHIIREGDLLGYKFFGHFVEDRTKHLPSYYDFLANLQRNVQQKAK